MLSSRCYFLLIFFTARRYASAVFAVVVCLLVCLSVTMSVRHGIVSKLLDESGCPSVCLSVPSIARCTPVRRVCCCGRGGQEISIGRHWRPPSATAANASSVTLSADVGTDWLKPNLSWSRHARTSLVYAIDLSYTYYY